MFVGGTGRVGSSAAAALLRQEPGVALVLAGRTESSFAAAVERHPTLRSTSCAFAACDCSDPASLAAVIAGADLVVHSAGPFQGGGDDGARCSTPPSTRGFPTWTCATTRNTPRLANPTKAAATAGVPCVTTGGIYPGVSNLMAAEMIEQNRASSEGSEGGANEVEYVLYNYFCAGSGGVATPSSPRATCSAARTWCVGIKARGS